MHDNIKIFCLPYAGGTASSYLIWNNFFKDRGITVVPVELAGRGNRFDDKPYKSFEEMVEDSFEFIIKYIKKNGIKKYVIFGHSMGAWIVYELCKRIFQADMTKPIHIIFSGNKPPYYPKKEKKIHNLCDEEFINEILKYGNAKREILEDKDFGKIFLKILRDDYTLIEKYTCKVNTLKIECPVSIFLGTDDILTKEGIENWCECTTTNMVIYKFEGGHFFLLNNMELVVDKIQEILE